jgi:hypothetical protein
VTAVGVADKAAILLDRTAVLFIGLAVGGVITYSFVAGGQADPAAATGTLPRAEIASSVSAASAEIPAPMTPRLASAVAEERKIHIGVFGDSFGDGLHASLYKQLPADQDFEVHKFSNPATGFTRYRLTNLLDDTRRKLDGQPVDIAILSFGANDMQGIYLDGRGAEFMSERWKQIVTERVTQVVELLRTRGAAIYWVGLPRMREPGYDRDVQAMNAFYMERMRRLNVPFIDTLSATVDASGAYAPYLMDPLKGERIMARTNDGIHMTIPGYYLLTRRLADRIKNSVQEARSRALPASRQAGTAQPGTGSRG